MELLGLLLIAGISTGDLNIEKTYPENIDYCVNIMYNPSLEQEFYNNCDLEVVNDYILSIKKGE